MSCKKPLTGVILLRIFSMKVILEDESNSPFRVPAGTYSARCIRSRPAKRKHCPHCAFENQVVLDFTVSFPDQDQDYIVSAQRCVRTKHCINRLSVFLNQWLEEPYYDYVERDGSFDLDRVIGKRADVVVENVQTYPHPYAYSKLACALPPGRLVD